MRHKIYRILVVCCLLMAVSASYSQQHRFRDDYNMFPVLPNYNDAGPYLVKRVDFTVTLRDGTIIDALKFVPVAAIPVGGWPSVIMVHGYGDNKETLAGFAQAQAEYGYYVTTFSMRGQGHSTGLSNLISTTEAQDMIEFVNFIKNDVSGGVSPNNILVMGGSQGGLVPFMAACYGMNVKTIISALAPPNFASSWIENGCIKMTCLWTMDYTSDTARYSQQVVNMRNWIIANNKSGWTNLAKTLPLNRDFMNIVQNNKVPILIEGSWQDKFFNASGIIQASNTLTSPFRLYLGAVQGHGGDHSATEDTWHMQLFNDWFFYYLFNIGTMNAYKYQYAYTTYPKINTAWTFVHDSSSVSLSQITSPVRFYLNRNNKLSSTPNNSISVRSTFKNAVSGGLTMQQAVDAEFKGTDFDSKFKVNSINFETDPLAANMQWLGTPKINLDYLATGNTFCQYNFQVYDVKPDGSAEFVNRIDFTDRNYSSNSRRQTSFNGAAHSHLFKAGDKIRLVVTNLDRVAIDSSFFGTNPFVLPVLVNSTNYIYLTSSSFVEFPVRPVTANLTDAVNSNTPVGFRLEQNYPNPFNPSTIISYSVPAENRVVISVYDVLGKKIRTLVNQVQVSGEYRVVMDGSSLSSGIYFYKIEAGEFTATRRMILVK